MSEPNEHPSNVEDRTATENAGRDPLVEIVDQLTELKAIFTHLAEVKIDQARRWARTAAFTVLVMTFVSIAAAALIVVSAVSIGYGAALGLSEAFGGRAWAGYLAAGILLPASIACSAWILITLGSNRRKRQLVAKYDSEPTEPEENAKP